MLHSIQKYENMLITFVIFDLNTAIEAVLSGTLVWLLHCPWFHHVSQFRTLFFFALKKLSITLLLYLFLLPQLLFLCLFITLLTKNSYVFAHCKFAHQTVIFHNTQKIEKIAKNRTSLTTIDFVHKTLPKAQLLGSFRSLNRLVLKHY